ncbi:MAG: hypothetical protein ACREQI_00975 [Candidatus Binataceae bacterium]
MKLKIAIAAAIIGTAFAASANAKPAAAPASSPAASGKAPAITLEQRELGIDMIGAIDANSPAAYRKLVLPKALACFNSGNQLYFDEWMSHQLEFPVKGKYALGIIELDKNQPSHGLYLDYRVPPTHDISISYTAADGSAMTLNRPIVRHGGKWYADIPCPTALEMKRLGAAHKQVAAAFARARRLYPKLKDPLKSQLAALLAKSDAPGAWKLCSKSMHVDIYTARALVSILAEKSPNTPVAAALFNSEVRSAP